MFTSWRKHDKTLQKKDLLWALNFTAERLETTVWPAKALIVNLCKKGSYLVPVCIHQEVHKTIIEI